ncbi:MAG: T9SS type A sorting domain-containing protein [Bacteroidales bacterium]|nr:T9SS type A sorting domain-containing protein [Bacteroidales bacterium]
METNSIIRKHALTKVKQLFLAGLFLSISAWVSAQCTPDTGCIDVGTPGQVCPDTLAGAFLGEAYYQPVTFIAPDSAFIGNSGVKITRIEIDTIANLPPGITYSTDTNIFFPDTMYCVLISGTPTDTGTFYIDISVIPYIWSDILGEVKMNPQHDSTSVFIVVSEPSFLPERKGTGFSLINPRPNPFRESVKIGFTTADPKNAELVVYDLSGQVIYRERLYSRPGKNYFRFTGAALYPGVYPYFVSTAGKRLAGKLVKLH